MRLVYLSGWSGFALVYLLGNATQKNLWKTFRYKPRWLRDAETGRDRVFRETFSRKILDGMRDTLYPVQFS